jgi:hypothetical protein
VSAYVVIDFSQVAEPSAPQPKKPRRDKLTRSRETLPNTALERLLPSIAETAPGRGVTYPPELLEAAKATFTASGGNVAEVARVHNIPPTSVTRLAAKHDWLVYGHGVTQGTKARKTRLESLAEVLENRLFQLADAMGVETKEIHDITEKGLGSKYVAPLTQRSSAFSAVFDRYMRVMALLEPELFAQDDDPSNPVAAKIRQRQHRDALGGVDGVDRRMAELAGRIAVSAMQALEESRELPDVVEAEVVDE